LLKKVFLRERLPDACRVGIRTVSVKTLQVVRANSTQAISRAAAVTDNSSVSFGLASCFRSPKITLSLVCSIWIAATAFVLLPVFYHCHSGLEYCVERNTSGFTDWKFLVMDNNMVLDALGMKVFTFGG